MSALNKNIKKIRSLRGLSQSDFADIFGLTRANIGSYEEGRAQPKMEVVVKMAAHFKLSLDDFVNQELSVNDLLKFQKLPDNSGIQKEDHSLDFKQVPFITKENFHKYNSLGRTKHNLSLPPNFDADFAFRLDTHHLEAFQDIAKGNILLMKRIQTSEIRSGFIHAVMNKKELEVGIAQINSDNLYLKGANTNHIVFESSLDNIKKIWRVTATIGEHNTNYEQYLLKNRIEQLENTLKTFISEHKK